MGIELDYIFHPRSIAVVGAASKPDQVNDFFRVLLGSPFNGALYPVNPNAEEIEGVQAYPDLAAIPGPVDYVISAISATGALRLVDQCITKGVKVIHFFTARMRETGHEEGIALEQELLRRAKAAGIRLIGPNGMGLYYPREGITFKPGFPREPGPVAAMSQSGGNTAQIVNLAAAQGARFSKVISYGNATDLTETDYLEYLSDDPETGVIAAYVEGVKEGRQFFDVLRRATRRKPVVLLKGGRTDAGTKMVASHTASVAGSQAVWDAMCLQAGAIPVSSMEQLTDTIVAFQFLRPAVGLQVGVAGGGGGMSVQAADACDAAGLNVIAMPPDIQEQLRIWDPVYWDWIGNPVDVSILGAGSIRLEDVTQLMADHPAFELLIGAMDEHFNLNHPNDVPRIRERVGALIEIGRRCAKPFAMVMGADLPRTAWKREAMAEMREMCVDAGVPVFPNVERAAGAIRRFVEYHRWLAKE